MTLVKVLCLSSPTGWGRFLITSSLQTVSDLLIHLEVLVSDLLSVICSSRSELLLLPLNKLLMLISNVKLHLVNHSVELEISVHIVCCFKKLCFMQIPKNFSSCRSQKQAFVWTSQEIGFKHFKWTVFSHAPRMLWSSVHGKPLIGLVPVTNRSLFSDAWIESESLLAPYKLTNLLWCKLSWAWTHAIKYVLPLISRAVCVLTWL